ncbi:LysR family transcriptional regulator [Pseudomonas sp. NPDC087612]|uniref:LysR family transcriptional regulator n=1 Tax=Pseudomonas sp. NPDC087612 TaxID=3364441 RepID=UPI0038021E7E
MVKNQFFEIRNFVTVAQAGSFTVAAQALGMTGSALSKSIMRLEARLGTKLLHRTTRRVSLTNDGDSYLADCQNAMAILDEAESRLGSEQRAPAGRVRIDLPSAFGRRYILPSLLDLSRQHEQLDLSITFSDRTVDLMGDGIDVAVRVGNLDDNVDLVARRLGEQRRVICGSPSYFSQRGFPLVKEDLQQHSCVTGWPMTLRHSWLLKSREGVTEPYVIPIRHEIGDCEAILSAALAGCGLAQVPTWLVEEHLRTGALVSVLDELAGDDVPMHAIWIKTPYIQPKLRAVIDRLIELATAPGSKFKP